MVYPYRNNYNQPWYSSNGLMTWSTFDSPQKQGICLLVMFFHFPFIATTIQDEFLPIQSGEVTLW